MSEARYEWLASVPTGTLDFHDAVTVGRRRRRVRAELGLGGMTTVVLDEDVDFE